jgi:hypothetical protein
LFLAAVAVMVAILTTDPRPGMADDFDDDFFGDGIVLGDGFFLGTSFFDFGGITQEVSQEAEIAGRFR